MSDLSKKLEEQITNYIELFELKEKRIENCNVVPQLIQEFRKLSGFIDEFKRKLEPDELSSLRDYGLISFIEKRKLLRKLLKVRDRAFKKQKIELKEFQKPGNRDRDIKAISAIFRTLKWLTNNDDIINDLLPEKLAFEYSGKKDKSHYISIIKLHKTYPKLADDLRAIHKYEINNIKSDQRANVSIKTAFRTFMSLWNHIEPELSIEEKELISSLGFVAFNSSDNKILKKCRYKIRSLVLNNELEASSGQTLNSNLNWMLQKMKLETIDSYPISSKRRKRHKERENKNKSYSKEDVQELAFHIEALLSQASITDKAKTELIFARVLIKTGWNITPVMELETDDLIQVNIPISGSTPYYVRLFKR
ncbi:hypothetical protein [Aliivibrio fischeri]|uniref:Uncharacterized protein n=1 Tax=Aliivibrio fischeri TaxID=668 RepID=A0A844P5K8_ALIFS|nr:hypothetical protein [Aliivibrio fischeri]MUK50769.1 hypothetical protein [Aliivibrio fischeri]